MSAYRRRAECTRGLWCSTRGYVFPDPTGVRSEALGESQGTEKPGRPAKRATRLPSRFSVRAWVRAPPDYLLFCRLESERVISLSNARATEARRAARVTDIPIVHLFDFQAVRNRGGKHRDSVFLPTGFSVPFGWDSGLFPVGNDARGQGWLNSRTGQENKAGTRMADPRSNDNRECPASRCGTFTWLPGVHPSPTRASRPRRP
jgi:hypothetical protein